MSKPPVRSACAAALIALAVIGPLPASAEDDPSIVELEKRVSSARERMERAYVTLETDHRNVRAKGFAATVGDHPGFVQVLAKLVAGARAEPAPTVADLMKAALATCRGLVPPPPLSAVALEGVLPATVAGARKDTAAGATDLFVAAAAHVFRHADRADVWDETFTGIELVNSYRESRTQLVSMRAKESAPTAPADPYAAMVLVPRGKAHVGPWDGWNHTLKPKQNRRHKLTLKAFYVDPTEVTCAAYLRFLEGVKKDGRKALLPGGWTLAEDGKAAFPEGRADHPVTRVSFEQAAAYAKSLGKRIPNEDEWERVAAGADETGRTYPWGAEAGEAKWNHGGGDGAGTSAVGEYPQDVTPDGVRGLAGNVSEIVATLPDRKHVRGSKLPKDGQAVARGGSYQSRAARCTSRYRTVVDPPEGTPTIGFRCVMDETEYKKRRK